MGTYGLGAFKKDWLLTGWVALKLSPLVICILLAIVSMLVFRQGFAISMGIIIDGFIYFVLAFSESARPYRYVVPPKSPFAFEKYTIGFVGGNTMTADMDAVVEWLKKRSVEITGFEMEDGEIIAHLNKVLGRFFLYLIHITNAFCICISPRIVVIREGEES